MFTVYAVFDQNHQEGQAIAIFANLPDAHFYIDAREDDELVIIKWDVSNVEFMSL